VVTAPVGATAASHPSFLAAIATFPRRRRLALGNATGQELRQLAILLFLLRLQFLHVAHELLEQLASLRSGLFVELLHDRFLASEPREVPRTADLDFEYAGCGGGTGVPYRRPLGYTHKINCSAGTEDGMLQHRLCFRCAS